MPERPSNPTLLRPPNPVHILPFVAFSLFFFLLCHAAVVSAEVRVVLSQGEFRMGDRDTPEDATRLATEAAKRNALEQVATYLESVTVVEGADISKDEIRTYTAGVILVLDQQTHLWLDGDQIVVTVDLMSQIDSDDVVQAILAFRENESARHQLITLKNEIDDLHKELEAANQLLASAATAEEAQYATLQRQELLNRVQSNAMVSQAWTDWVIVGPYGYPASWGGVPPYGLLSAARGLYPGNPHLDLAQQSIVIQSPPVPHNSPSVTQPALRLPGMRPVPLTLNEITHKSSTQPVRLGNPPASGHLPVPSPNGHSGAQGEHAHAPPGAGIPAPGQHLPSFGGRSVQSSLQQFLQPPALTTPSGQLPVTRRLPPAMHQHLPSLLGPRGSYHGAPRGLSGHYGSARGGSGGGGGRGR